MLHLTNALYPSVINCSTTWSVIDIQALSKGPLCNDPQPASDEYCGVRVSDVVSQSDIMRSVLVLTTYLCVFIVSVSE